DRDVRHWRPRTAFGCDAYLRCHLRGRGKRDDPPMIHYDFKAEDVGVEISGFRHVGRGKVGDDALDDHVRMLSARATPPAPPPSNMMNWRRITRSPLRRRSRAAAAS